MPREFVDYLATAVEPLTLSDIDLMRHTLPPSFIHDIMCADRANCTYLPSWTLGLLEKTTDSALFTRRCRVAILESDTFGPKAILCMQDTDQLDGRDSITFYTERMPAASRMHAPEYEQTVTIYAVFHEQTILKHVQLNATSVSEPDWVHVPVGPPFPWQSKTIACFSVRETRIRVESKIPLPDRNGTWRGC